MQVYVIPCQAKPIYQLEIPDRDVDRQSELIREVVGGHFEIIYAAIDGVLLWANEEGKLLGLPLNMRATVLAGLETGGLVGNVVVTGQQGPNIAEPPLEIEEHWSGQNGHQQG
jgi:hypothetical protein